MFTEIKKQREKTEDSSKLNLQHVLVSQRQTMEPLQTLRLFH